MTALQQARAKGEAGIESSAQHAEEEVPGWGELAFTMVRWYSKYRDRKWEGDGDKPFRWKTADPGWTAEECRIWCAAHDLPDPPELRAWGSVIQRALREGLIVKTGGYRATVASNGSARALYRKA